MCYTLSFYSLNVLQNRNQSILFVHLNGNNLYVYDDELKVLATKAISVNGNISISEKNNNLYITIIGDTAVTIIFDTKTNSFIN